MKPWFVSALALLFLLTPIVVHGEEGRSGHSLFYQKISLWARYCEISPKKTGESCAWTFITDNMMVRDAAGPQWTTVIGCVMQADRYIAQFIENNPSYRSGYFERRKCYFDDQRPSLDV